MSEETAYNIMRGGKWKTHSVFSEDHKDPLRWLGLYGVGPISIAKSDSTVKEWQSIGHYLYDTVYNGWREPVEPSVQTLRPLELDRIRVSKCYIGQKYVTQLPIVLKKLLELKYTDSGLADMLIHTRPYPLDYQSPDSYLGLGSDRLGRNLLAKWTMEIRERLYAEHLARVTTVKEKKE